MTYETIEVRAFAGALGAEVSGVDLSKPLDNQVFSDIHQALLNNLIIVFRNQNLNPQQQLEFAKYFGGIHFHPYISGLADCPEVMPIIKEASDTHTFGSGWHTDQMFTQKPAMGTMLYVLETPHAGGDTLFANLYLAYEALSDGMKAMLAEVKTYAVGDNFKQAAGKSRKNDYKGTSKMSDQVRDPGDIVTESEHPIVRTHPETGRKALYIGSHAQRFANMTDAESEPLLNFLKAHATRPEFTCRVNWKPGTLTFWDNRCTEHHAIADYDGYRRVAHRITIKGDKPF
jgi:taurine dioxygenase